MVKTPEMRTGTMSLMTYMWGNGWILVVPDSFILLQSTQCEQISREHCS